MRQSKIIGMAFVAMFMFSGVANAQFGGLKKLAKKVADKTVGDVKESAKGTVEGTVSDVKNSAKDAVRDATGGIIDFNDAATTTTTTNTKEAKATSITKEKIEDEVAWNNKTIKKAIIDYLSDLPYCGAKKERNPELKGCKVADVYLTSQWQEGRKTNSAGDKFRTVYFWVIVEATNGKNYAIKGDAHQKYVYGSGHPEDLDSAEPDFRNILEVTDWVRKTAE